MTKVSAPGGGFAGDLTGGRPARGPDGAFDPGINMR